MTKVHVGVPLADKPAVLAWLQEEEALHIVPLDEEATPPEDSNSTAYRLAQVQFALEFIQRIKAERQVKTKRNWRQLFAGKPIASLAELEKVMAKHALDEQLQQIRRASDQLSEEEGHQTALKEEMGQLAPWRSLELRDESSRAAATHRLVSIPIARLDAVVAAVEAVPTAAWQEVHRQVSKKQGTVYLEVVAGTADAAALDTALAEHDATVASLQLEAGQTPTERLEHLKGELSASEERYNSVLAAAEELLALEHDLKLIYDGLLHQQEREALEENVASLQFAFVVAGWLPAATLPVFTKRLHEAIPAAAVEEVTPAPEEQPPISFDNPKLLKPFEAVTDIYGKPRYHELDPSPFLSLFFLISFGLALTDAGYGLVMMAGMFAAERFFRLKESMRKMVRLLFYSGLFTTIIGALRNALLAVKLIDPIQEPITLLLIAFGIGIVQLLFAWGIKGYDLWRNGEKSAALLDSAAWISLVILVLAWAAGEAALGSQAHRFVSVLLLANVALMVATQGRTHKNILLRLGSGVLSLYGLVSFLSDVLSYSRLLALGLATGIIGLVVNLIGGMVTEMVPVVGFALAIIVLLGGHAFNLGINALGAFIHSGRLQFVEFFPKFMEGGGVSYKPFGRVGKYVDNPRDFV